MPYQIVGPDVLCLGWIPKIRNFYKLPGYRKCLDGCSALERVKLEGAFFMIFSSGNPVKDHIWDDLRSFLKWLKSMEYRAAAVLTGVRLICDDNGTPVDVKARGLRDDLYIGGTPMPGRMHYDRGCGHSSISREVDAQRGLVQASVMFQIGKAGKFISKHVFGLSSPFASVNLAYAIRSDGSITIEANGTFIPSQRADVGRQGNCTHFMDGNSRDQIMSFLTAKDDFDAPLRGPQVVQLKGQRVEIPR